MGLRVFNSYTGTKEDFKPRNAKRVKIYNCGPTVYYLNHIGNFRSYMFVDLLRRYLVFRDYGVEQTMNITDVDDKIIENALKEKKTIKDFTAPYVSAFLEDIQYLKIQDVEHRPRATDYIPIMLEMIGELERNGHTYKMDGNIYFRLSSFEDYGRLSKLESQNLMVAASGRFEADEYTKEDVRDFALWKIPVRQDEPGWESRWGKGRPGWHLECSAMIRKIYGKKGIDIHTGGVDLLFPHHENEIAQSVCAYSADNFVRYWLHNEHLLVDGKKMSKSLGNFFTLRDLTDIEFAEKLAAENRAPDFILKFIRKNIMARALRHLLISIHYRTKLNFTFENLKASHAACERLQTLTDRLLEITGMDDKRIKSSLKKLESETGKKRSPGQGGERFAAIKNTAGTAMKEFITNMDDDLNISRGMAAVFDLVRDINALMKNNKMSGELAEHSLLFLYRINQVIDLIDFRAPEVRTDIEETGDQVEAKYIDEMITLRNQARKNKNFSEADKIRDQLIEKGILLKDTPGGTTWERK